MYLPERNTSLCELFLSDKSEKNAQFLPQAPGARKKAQQTKLIQPAARAVLRKGKWDNRLLKKNRQSAYYTTWTEDTPGDLDSSQLEKAGGFMVVWTYGNDKESERKFNIEIFSCTDPSDMYYDVLADRVKFFKENKEGIAVMCKAMEDMRNQTLKEGMINVAKRMLADGTLTLEKIAEYAGLSLDEVKKLKADRTA